MSRLGGVACTWLGWVGVRHHEWACSTCIARSHEHRSRTRHVVPTYHLNLQLLRALCVAHWLLLWCLLCRTLVGYVCGAMPLSCCGLCHTCYVSCPAWCTAHSPEHDVPTCYLESPALIYRAWLTNGDMNKFIRGRVAIFQWRLFVLVLWL